MNTRIQVEHTVTEMVTGFDLVREQILVAAGEPLSMTQAEIHLRGHAIECRINAEDVTKGFLPAPGLITAYEQPSGPGVRVDSGVRAGDEISGLYDPIIAKLIVVDGDRELARRRMLRALAEFRIEGPPTLVGFHRALLEHPCFIAGETCHGTVESEELAQRAVELAPASADTAAQASTGTLPTRPQLVGVEIDGREIELRFHFTEPRGPSFARARRQRHGAWWGRDVGGDHGPMQGTVLKVAVADGDQVEAGQLLCVIEAMKMENEIGASRAGVVEGLAVAVGDAVASGQLLCLVAEQGA